MDHIYKSSIRWTGNMGTGTSGYKAYKRNHTIQSLGKHAIDASSDPAFNGDGDRYNPEEILVASLSSCHMLWYLHLCAVNHVVVVAYEDNPTGIMEEKEDGSGMFKEVTLHPKVTVSKKSMITKAIELHSEAHKKCFIARSVNFPVHHQPFTITEEN